MKYRSLMNLWYPAGFWFWNFRCSIFRTRKRQCVNGMAGLQGCPGSLYDDDSCNTQVGFHWLKILLLLIGLKCNPIKAMCPWRIRKGWIQWIWNQKKLCSYYNQRISGIDYVIITSLWHHVHMITSNRYIEPQYFEAISILERFSRIGRVFWFTNYTISYGSWLSSIRKYLSLTNLGSLTAFLT